MALCPDCAACVLPRCTPMLLLLRAALLQVFRTNASYARWLDARKTWGLVLNRSRDLVRQVGCHGPCLLDMLANASFFIAPAD